ncbi:MAG: hypothetical protein ACP5OZ_01195 [Candidatus Woesearchaeota archaeon]
MKNKIFLVSILAMLIFLSGCDKKKVEIEGDTANACFFRSCEKEESINGWTTFLEGEKIIDFKSEEDCIKKVYETFGVEQRVYSSLNARVYGLDYKYVKNLNKEEKEALTNISESIKNNPYGEYQKALYDKLINKYPKLSFLKIPCACSKFCVTPKGSYLNIKVSTDDLKGFSCGDKDDLEIGYYAIHNDCCWVKSFNCDINPYSEECSWFKCGEIKSSSAIPSCGCLCGTEILTIESNKCCSNDNVKNC